VASFQRILFPTDFSDCSKQALGHALALAEKFSSELHLLFVEDDPILNAPTTAQSYRDRAAREAPQKFAQLLPPEQCKGLTVKTAVREGTADLAILDYANENGIDVIVMATHGRTGLSHILLGSVTESVLHKAPCAVLAVRTPPKRESD
jgi:nucleotide-binding universal stress UspA family protein